MAIDLRRLSGVQRSSEGFFGALRAAVSVSRTREASVLMGGVLELERQIKLNLSHPGHGTPYTRGGKLAVRSAPGEPPARDTSTLFNTIGHDVLWGEGKIRIGSGQEYAPLLEFGTDTMEPRPFMRAAFERAKPTMTQLVSAELKRSTPKGV